MRLRILGSELGSLAVSLQRLSRLFILEQVRELQPRACLTFFEVRGRLERSRSPQKLVGVRIIGAGEHQAKVEIRFKNVRLRSDGLAIRSNGFLGAFQAIESKAQIKPGLIIVGVFVESFFQQRYRAGKIALLDRIFRLGNFRRLIVDALLVMADRRVVLRKKGGGVEPGDDELNHDEQDRVADRTFHAWRLCGLCRALVWGEVEARDRLQKYSTARSLLFTPAVRRFRSRPASDTVPCTSLSAQRSLRAARTRPDFHRDRRLPDQDQ